MSESQTEATVPTTQTFINSKYDVPAEKREALTALSKEVYGATSRWIKLATEGRLQLETEEVTELVPAEDESGESTERKVQVPVKYKNTQMNMLSKRRLSLEEVEAEMNARKEILEMLRAQAKANRDAQIAAQKALQDQARMEQEVAALTGSAL